MTRIERLREKVTGPLDLEHLMQKVEAGWRLVALEWRREIEGEEATPPKEEVPYGLRVADDGLRLEEEPEETRVLLAMMELIVQDYPFSKVAKELNERGFRSRDGSRWNPVTVFNMLPRLIEVGPKIFSSNDWEVLRTKFPRNY
ncbi:MAG TPA: recombinase family protein [Candidatus Angelobacter sp.]|jgi:hypothetical protein|nr:recombinase family protein [Candidatus Angelobacter sp.]